MAVGFIARVGAYVGCSRNPSMPSDRDRVPSEPLQEDPMGSKSNNDEEFNEDEYNSYGRSIIQSLVIGTLNMSSALELASTHGKTKRDLMLWRGRYFQELDSERCTEQKTTLEQAKREARERLAQAPTRITTYAPKRRKSR